MGPCLFRHGNQFHAASVASDPAASMGPCLFRHGNQVMQKVCHTARIASMGPCLFRHGNFNATIYGCADLVLQWGRAFSGTEIT